MKNLIFEGFRLVSAGSAIVVVSAAMSTAMSTAILFGAAPFTPDSTEAVLKDWVGRSLQVLAAGTGFSIACGVIGIFWLKHDNDEFRAIQEGRSTQAQTFSIDYDLVFGKFEVCESCKNCKFLNPDTRTRSILHCAEHPEIPIDGFCSSFSPKE